MNNRVLLSISKLRSIKNQARKLSTKVPITPVQTLEKKQNSEVVNVDKNTIALLERLSLVKTDPVEGVKVLEDSIAFANQILHINTEGVEPLYSVLEERNLNLREDKITQGNCQKEILKNASVTEDDYFVAPLGNIPLHEVEVEENQAETKHNEVQYTSNTQ